MAPTIAVLISLRTNARMSVRSSSSSSFVNSDFMEAGYILLLSSGKLDFCSEPDSSAAFASPRTSTL